MPVVGAELLKLDQLVVLEVSRLRNKFSLWGVKPAIDINWPGGVKALQSEPGNYQKMLKTLQSIPNLDRLTEEQQVLVGIGWEFIWGVNPPLEVTHLRENLLKKSRYGKPITDQERLWLQIMTIDSDSF